jgi:hypothetical protein
VTSDAVGGTRGELTTDGSTENTDREANLSRGSNTEQTRIHITKPKNAGPRFPSFPLPCFIRVPSVAARVSFVFYPWPLSEPKSGQEGGRQLLSHSQKSTCAIFPRGHSPKKWPRGNDVPRRCEIGVGPDRLWNPFRVREFCFSFPGVREARPPALMCNRFRGKAARASSPESARFKRFGEADSRAA